MTYESNNDTIEVDTIILLDSEGNEIEYEYLDMVELNNSRYAVLLPIEGQEVIILEIVEEEGEEDILLEIEDCHIVDQVYQIFKERNSDIYDFED